MDHGKAIKKESAFEASPVSIMDHGKAVKKESAFEASPVSIMDHNKVVKKESAPEESVHSDNPSVLGYDNNGYFTLDDYADEDMSMTNDIHQVKNEESVHSDNPSVLGYDNNGYFTLDDYADEDMSMMNDIHQVKNEDSETSEYSSDDDNAMLFDTACALCDDGGRVLMCEGRCMRCFHPTIASGCESLCESLGFANKAEYHAIPSFVCDNCTHKVHQCFICGVLGSSDLASATAVFQCSCARCGHFYHPDCVAKQLHPYNATTAQKLTAEIVSGNGFICPTHKCWVCGQYENREEYELQFALCRRCPVTFHRKCLPSSIRLGNCVNGSRQQRAWDNVLPNRIMMYFMRHKPLPKLQTPKRNHLLYPAVEFKVTMKNATMEALVEKRSKAYGNLASKPVGTESSSK